MAVAQEIKWILKILNPTNPPMHQLNDKVL